MMDDLSETDRIERDLARTRARMDSRLEELQDHLTPRQMLNDAFAYFRGGDGADFTKDLVARARANPLPVALTGIGIAWLMASTGKAGATTQPVSRHDDVEARLRLAEESVHRLDADDDASYAGRRDDARGKVVGVARTASDTASSYAQRIKDAVTAASRNLRETSHDLSAGANDALHRLGSDASTRSAAFQEGTHDMATSSRNAFSATASNPFALGAIAALVGLVAGSLLPVSDEERQALGSTATKLRTAGRDLAQDVVDRGGHIAADTLDAMKGSAEAHGLSGDRPVGELLGSVKSGNLLGEVKQVAQETLQAGRDSAQTHLASGGLPANESRSS
jgi:ElaB/YqjD/DUF883 family membrane-anchored ribosome-binding protein